MDKLLNIARDVQGYPVTSLNLRPYANIRYSATLASATEATLTVPSTFTNWEVFFNYEAAKNVWISINGTAAVPAGATLAATTSVLNPPGFILQKGDVIHVITADADTDIGIELFPIN